MPCVCCSGVSQVVVVVRMMLLVAWVFAALRITRCASHPHCVLTLGCSLSPPVHISVSCSGSLENRLETVVAAVMACVRKGAQKESRLAGLAVSMVSISMGGDQDALFNDVEVSKRGRGPHYIL